MKITLSDPSLVLLLGVSGSGKSTFAREQFAAHELTAHETRILKLLVEGHNYKTAALELHVSVNTISFHVRSIYYKLQVHSKSEAVAKALKNSLV